MSRVPIRLLLAAILSWSTAAIAGDGELIFEDGFESGGTTAWEYKLTISNYLAWCEVTVDDNAPSAAAEIVAYFPPGTVVPLFAEPLPPFVWGYWVGTDGDVGSHDPSQTTTATMTGDKTIQACCPFAGDDCGTFP
jgi:hypothetical protein